MLLPNIENGHASAGRHCKNEQVVGCVVKAGNTLVASRGELRGRPRNLANAASSSRYMR